MRTFVVKTEELRACPHCQSRRLKDWCTGRDRLHGLSRQEFRYARCEDCALVFLSLRPLAEEAHKFYPEHYGPYQAERAASSQATSQAASSASAGGRAGLVGKALTRMLNALDHRTERLLPDAVAAKVETYYQPPAAGARLLDFGCGSDVFLNSARARGWETTGLDFSEAVVRRVAESGHRALLMSPRVWDEIADESLDFVRMSHVLEHLYAPREVLGQLGRKMKAGAALHVSMPNPDGLSAKLFGSRWWGLECPRHVLLYSPGVLRRVLAESGFAVAETLHEVITKDCARSLGYLMADRGWLAGGEVEGMTRRTALAGALRLPAKVAAALGLADRYHTFARKAAGAPADAAAL
jgi:2-polyprenyl-3-methyl-5-hydroxy-6-metoxy-1,4-benzoquinol methylase